MGDIARLVQLNGHPARYLLKMYKHRGVPVIFIISRWSRSKVIVALLWGVHKSCHDHTYFLNTEFVDMIHKGQWVYCPP